MLHGQCKGCARTTWLNLLEGTFGEDDWSDNNFKKELCEFLGVEYVENLNKW